MFKASAPGSLMILGEYAVLEGYPALVAAIDKRMSVEIKPREDNKVFIHSALGDYETSLDDLEIIPPFSFVLAALQKYSLTQGCEIHIQAEFSDQMGFASSAAVTVATLSAIAAWQQKNLTPLQLISDARDVVRKVQGFGSGADVAACVMGGFVEYRPEPLFAASLTHHPLTVVYSGAKTKTADALQFVKNHFLHYPELFQKILHAIGDAAEQGIQAVKNQDWQSLGKIMNIHQGFHHALGVNTPLLNQMVDSLRNDSEILGAKISGSGLGDCVIGLGQPAVAWGKVRMGGVEYIPVNIAIVGVTPKVPSSHEVWRKVEMGGGDEKN